MSDKSGNTPEAMGIKTTLAPKPELAVEVVECHYIGTCPFMHIQPPLQQAEAKLNAMAAEAMEARYQHLMSGKQGDMERWNKLDQKWQAARAGLAALQRGGSVTVKVT